MRNVVAYYLNDNYSTYLKEVVDRENPGIVGLDFHSIYEFHDALGSSHDRVRDEAKFLLDIVKYCKDRGVALEFYGFKNYQKEKLYDKLEGRRNRIHKGFDKFIKRAFRYSKALKQPYWAHRSKSHGLYLRLSRWNDKHFSGDPYHLHEAVLKEKSMRLPDNCLILSHYAFYNAIKNA